ncbi:hypothetical protein [Burkholderia sp. 22PA0106]|uniref:hypothetical protein n=1 Tax=Burkholderia sp. 22PA0106 TaxID=3237371 RepID=UPI0039C03C02
MEIQRTFEEHGLWIRTVQMKNCQCLTDATISFNQRTRLVGNLDGDSWTYVHPTIPQYLYQFAPDNGKRAVALIVDWTKTKDRFVEYSLIDMSSNKRFPPNTLAKTPDETERDMRKMRAELAGKTHIEHNEVRACQIRKDALVGLVWNPVTNGTSLSEGRATWEASKPAFENFIKKLQKHQVAASGLPIFMYSVSGGMALHYLDFIS